MPLPDSRNRTYTDGDPIIPADLNDLQDAVLEGWHAEIPLTLSAWGWQFSAGYTRNAPEGYITSTGGAAVATMPIPVRNGQRLKEIRFERYGDGAADIAITVYKTDMVNVGSATSIETGAVTNPPAAWATTTLDVDPDVVFAPGEGLTVELVANAANIRLGSLVAVFDRPA